MHLFTVLAFIVLTYVFIYCLPPHTHTHLHTSTHSHTHKHKHAYLFIDYNIIIISFVIRHSFTRHFIKISTSYGNSIGILKDHYELPTIILRKKWEHY